MDLIPIPPHTFGGGSMPGTAGYTPPQPAAELAAYTVNVYRRAIADVARTRRTTPRRIARQADRDPALLRELTRRCEAIAAELDVTTP